MQFFQDVENADLKELLCAAAQWQATLDAALVAADKTNGNEYKKDMKKCANRCKCMKVGC